MRSPERVLWAKEGVVGAEAVVVTGLRTILLLGYGRQNLNQNFNLLKITPSKGRSPIKINVFFRALPE